MTSELTLEQARAEATALVATDRTAWQMRSCHRCNPAHNHITNRPDGPLVNCFDCGHWYFKGFDITEDEPTIEPASAPTDRSE